MTIQNYSREPAYITNSGKQMCLFKLWATFTFMDGESGERWDVQYPGEALHFGDKGLYKAITGATKYALLKNLLLSSDDDVENHNHSASEEQKTRPPATAQVKAAAKTTTQKSGAARTEPRVVEGTVQQVAQLQSKKGTQYVAVFVRKSRFTTFDRKMFPALLASSEKQIRLRVQDVTRGGKKFPEIIEVLPPAEGLPESKDPDPLAGPWDDAPGAA
jgi:hypothetical protein